MAIDHSQWSVGRFQCFITTWLDSNLELIRENEELKAVWRDLTFSISTILPNCVTKQLLFLDETVTMNTEMNRSSFIF